ncbi:MAG: TIGR00289 family protein [Methanosarcinales archaeon]|nr:TIGR00289 family protein [Methanosarcinales archaeon]
MKLAALTSGGKDSIYAIHIARLEGHEVTHLVTIKPARDDSYMFHSINIHMVDMISRACGIPLVVETSSGEKEEELADLERALSALDVDGVVVGAIESVYQGSRVHRICDELGLEVVEPLWHRDPEQLLRDMVRVMDIRIVQVAAMGLDEKWLGRVIDSAVIDELLELNRNYRIHICGEGGEYETLVLDAPFFNSKIQILESKTAWKGDWGFYNVEDVKLVQKGDISS